MNTGIQAQAGSILSVGPAAHGVGRGQTVAVAVAAVPVSTAVTI